MRNWPLMMAMTEDIIKPKFPEKARLPTNSISSSHSKKGKQFSFSSFKLVLWWMPYLLCVKQRCVPHYEEERVQDTCSVCFHQHCVTNTGIHRHTEMTDIHFPYFLRTSFTLCNTRAVNLEQEEKHIGGRILTEKLFRMTGWILLLPLICERRLSCLCYCYHKCHIPAWFFFFFASSHKFITSG